MEMSPDEVAIPALRGITLKATSGLVGSAGHEVLSQAAAPSLRGISLLQDLLQTQLECQERHGPQGPGVVGYAECALEDRMAAVALIVLLSVSMVVVMVLNFSFRDHKEDMVVPLCPALLVRSEAQFLKLPISTGLDEFDVCDTQGQHVCGVKIEWPDHADGPGEDFVAKAFILAPHGDVLCGVVAQLDAFLGEELRLLRPRGDVFGFVEAESEMKYRVRSRPGDIHLMTLEGDFEEYSVDGWSPAGSLVCSVRMKGGECVCVVHEHVDTGLVLSALLAIHIQRRIPNTAHPKHFDCEEDVQSEPEAEYRTAEDTIGHGTAPR